MKSLNTYIKINESSQTSMKLTSFWKSNSAIISSGFDFNDSEQEILYQGTLEDVLYLCWVRGYNNFNEMYVQTERTLSDEPYYYEIISVMRTKNVY